MRRFYGAIGALLGISVFRKVYNELIFLTNGDLTSKFCLITISQFFTWRFFINFGALNFLLIFTLLIPRICRWIIFGNLNQYEINSVKEKFNYTLFEFIMGLLVLRHVEGTSVGFVQLAKYAGIFVCVVLTKSFHYLNVIRVKSFVNNQVVENGRCKVTKYSMKLGMGMLVLALVDSLLIYKFIKDDYNTLSVIFGFELLNIAPLIILSGLQFTIALSPLNSKFQDKSIIKSKVILEFLMNLTRFSMFIIYTWFFNHYFTIPIHIIPSSYQCLRILLQKTKSLIAYKRNEISFKRFDTMLPKIDHFQSSISKSRCFCFEDFELNEDLRKLDCDHVFHYECLKWWLIKSQSCPICRDEVSLTKKTKVE